MRKLPNARHERFARALADGAAPPAAYRAAGYRPDRRRATALAQSEAVAARVATLKERAASTTVPAEADKPSEPAEIVAPPTIAERDGVVAGLERIAAASFRDGNYAVSLK